MRRQVTQRSPRLALVLLAAGCATEPLRPSILWTEFELKFFSGAPLPYRYDQQDPGTYYELLGDFLTFDAADSVTNTIIVRHVAAAQGLDTIIFNTGRAAYSVFGPWLRVSHACCPPMDQMCGGPPCPAVDVGTIGSDGIILFRDWDARQPTLRYIRATNHPAAALSN